MQKFLDKVADHIHDKYAANISELTLVLPNKRAGIFLKRSIALKFNRTLWSPRIFSIEEFMSALSGRTISHPVSLLFELYASYKNIAGDKAQPFDEYVQWASILLNDFSELDSYCADSKSLFNYLDEIKAIELWQPDNHELSPFQKQYLEFWEMLGKIYEAFSASLEKNKNGTQGAIYRAAAETTKFNKETAKLFPGPLLFAGFNALTKAEEIVFQHFIDNHNAEIVWDIDAYYFDNIHQEAGNFLRSNTARFNNNNSEDKSIHWKFNHLGRDKKEIEIIAVPGNVLQAKVAGSLLKSLYNTTEEENNKPVNTAIVLCDESLLLPVLHSLPGEVSKLNITMGYPLSYSAFFDFWATLCSVQENARVNSDKILFEHRNLSQLLTHPFLKTDHRCNRLPEIITHFIRQHNRTYISLDEIETIASKEGHKAEFEFIKNYLTGWKTPLDSVNTSIAIIHHRFHENSFESESLTAFLEIFNLLKSYLEKFPWCSDQRTLRVLFNQLAESCTIPFSGEPVTGLQVMGMLETRTLDFENVILLSANEDTLPSGKKQNSFFPLDVKRKFGLPVYSDKDAIFAYHFYRLLQRTKKMYVTYNNDNSKNFASGNSEKSRFLIQLLQELPAVNTNTTLREKVYSPPAITVNTTRLRIEKEETILKKLEQLSEKGFSPTALNTFLQCPLDFYYKYILGLREQKTVEENIESSGLGVIIHAVLHELYKPFLGKTINPGDIFRMKNNYRDKIRDSFLSQYSQREIETGKNLLAVKVAEKYISSFLDKEAAYLRNLESQGKNLSILGLETEMETFLRIQNKNIKIKGKMDRIDQTEDLIRIIDYKTGNVQSSDIRLETASVCSLSNWKPMAFQLMLYLLIYNNNNPVKIPVLPGLVPLRNFSEDFLPLKIAEDDISDKNTLITFEEDLLKIISGIFDPQAAFEHAESSEYCEYCEA